MINFSNKKSQSLFQNYTSKYQNLFLRFPKKFIVDYDPTKDYYKTLGISQAADEKEVKAAYYKLAKMYHPDINKGQTTEKFKEINMAYEVLSDKDKKLQYDASRKFNSFFGGKTYQQQQQQSTSQNTYNYNNFRGFNSGFNTGGPKTGQSQGSGYNYNQDPFFKNFNDWFKGFQNKGKEQDKEKRDQNYKSNFTSGKKYDFSKKYYDKNKNYFASFKIKENPNETAEDSYQKPKKEAQFGKKYYEKNKKYYDTFKPKNEDNQGNQYNQYNQGQQNKQYTDEGQYQNQNQNQNQNQGNMNSNASQFVIFAFSILGVILGSMIIRRVIYGSPQPHSQHQPRQSRQQLNQTQNNPASQKQTYQPAYNNPPQQQTYQPVYNNPPKEFSSGIQFERMDKPKGQETERGMRDDPFNKK